MGRMRLGSGTRERPPCWTEELRPRTPFWTRVPKGSSDKENHCFR